MATVESTTEIMPEDLLAIPDGDRFELIDGQLLERHVSTLSSWVGGVVFNRLFNFSHVNDLGQVWPADNGLQCFDDAPRKVRRPDVTFVAKDRLPAGWQLNAFLQVVPDLVVEVVSPNDLAYAVDEKVAEYQRAGVPLIWIINPQSRTVRIHRADGSFGWLLEQAELDGESVLAGFRCPVRDLFPPT